MKRIEYQDMEGRLHVEKVIDVEYMETYIKCTQDNKSIFILPINNVRWIRITN